MTTSVPVTGSATDANFLKYVLEIAIAGTPTYTTLAVGTAPVINGTLGTLDPTVLLNDLYTVRLTVYDRGGNRDRHDHRAGRPRREGRQLQHRLRGSPRPGGRHPDHDQPRLRQPRQAEGDFGVGWRMDIRRSQMRV